MGNIFFKLGKWVRRLADTGDWILTDLTGTEEERIAAEFKVGTGLAQRYLAEEDETPSRRGLLSEVGGRLAECPQCRKRHFRFAAQKAPEVNAFAVPGGFIFVTGALMELCESRDELAFVLAHEMGHVVLWHAVDAYKARVLLGGMPSTPTTGWVTRMGRELARHFLESQYSQEQELDADQFAVRLMKSADYDLAAAVRFLQKLPDDKSSLGVYFSSHPPRHSRVKQLG